MNMLATHACNALCLIKRTHRWVHLQACKPILKHSLLLNCVVKERAAQSRLSESMSISTFDAESTMSALFSIRSARWHWLQVLVLQSCTRAGIPARQQPVSSGSGGE